MWSSEQRHCRNGLIHRLGYIPPRARPRPLSGYRCFAEHWVTGRISANSMKHCVLDGPRTAIQSSARSIDTAECCCSLFALETKIIILIRRRGSTRSGPWTWLFLLSVSQYTLAESFKASTLKFRDSWSLLVRLKIRIGNKYSNYTPKL